MSEKDNGIVEGTLAEDVVTVDRVRSTRSGPTSFIERLAKPLVEFDSNVRHYLNRMTAGVMALYAFILVGVVLISTVSKNPEVFVLNEDTQNVLAQFYNVIIWMLVPFLLGMMGAAARVLLAGFELKASKKLTLSSGMMAAFSWLGIKSKVFLALVAPYVVSAQQVKPEGVVSTVGHISSEFYSMALVAVLVGMFASNIYIFINQRVEKLAREAEQTRS